MIIPLILASILIGACDIASKQGASAPEVSSHPPTEPVKSLSEEGCSTTGSCVSGFLSHAMNLVIKPEGSEEAPFSFRDATELSDRFDTVFIEPLLPPDTEASKLDIHYFPQVTRTNFAEGFDVVLSGKKNHSTKTDQQGNFSIEGIEDQGAHSLRITKTFAIRLVNNSSKAIKFWCLTFKAKVDGVNIHKAQRYFVEGVHQFSFYYAEDQTSCLGLDSDGDGSPDEQDSDDDNDGVADGDDCSPLDPAKWQIQRHFVDGDYDGIGSAVKGAACMGDTILTGFATSSHDCNDGDPKVFQSTSAYQDKDGDGFGADPITHYCIGLRLPKGLSLNNRDCDDSSASLYQWLAVYADPDGDGLGAGGLQEVCSGEQPPENYSYVAGDCAPGDPRLFQYLEGYLDADHDGHGWGDLRQVCSGHNLSVGFATNNHDCNDADQGGFQSLPYTFVDKDKDGYQVASPGHICTGHQLPEGYSVTASAIDCDDHNPKIFQKKFLYQDRDQDGYGGPHRVAICVGQNLPTGYSQSSSDCDDTDKSRYDSITYKSQDMDEDGYFLASTGTYCGDGTLPPNLGAQRPTQPDCDDNHPDRFELRPYTFIDGDGDGYFAPQEGHICSGGGLPMGYTIMTLKIDCDDESPTRFQYLQGYLDQDQDGYGHGSGEEVCSGPSLPLGYSDNHHDAFPMDPSRHQLTPPIIGPEINLSGVTIRDAFLHEGHIITLGGYSAAKLYATTSFASGYMAKTNPTGSHEWLIKAEEASGCRFHQEPFFQIASVKPDPDRGYWLGINYRGCLSFAGLSLDNTNSPWPLGLLVHISDTGIVLEQRPLAYRLKEILVARDTISICGTVPSYSDGTATPYEFRLEQVAMNGNLQWTIKGKGSCNSLATDTEGSLITKVLSSTGLSIDGRKVDITGDYPQGLIKISPTGEISHYIRLAATISANHLLRDGSIAVVGATTGTTGSSFTDPIPMNSRFIAIYTSDFTYRKHIILPHGGYVKSLARNSVISIPHCSPATSPWHTKCQVSNLDANLVMVSEYSLRSDLRLDLFPSRGRGTGVFVVSDGVLELEGGSPLQSITLDAPHSGLLIWQDL